MNKEGLMSFRTYYQILGVSRDATTEEITAAKNALAKVYHPDANMSSGVDTTSHMQEILEAYRVLSNPEKRRKYDLELGGGKQRVFRTFKVGEDSDADEQDSFVVYWNAGNALYEIVTRSVRLWQRESRRKGFSVKILEKLGKQTSSEKMLNEELSNLALQALQHITTLKTAGIPMDYWIPEAMNWMLIQWGQTPGTDCATLIARYDAYINKNKSGSEKAKLRTEAKQFHNHLKKLLTYAL